MAYLFFSYSHRDEELRDELEIHLSSLRRQGFIDSWHDRRLVAGSNVDDAISAELEKADIVLLLISPYFINSDYCYDKEMARALERHESKEAQVIPVILHPSDWHDLPFGKLLATPNDGKPVSKFANPHEAYLQISKAIKQAASKFNTETQQVDTIEQINPVQIVPTQDPAPPRSSNLRIKKEFSDHDIDNFLDRSFEYMAKFFDASLDELANRNSELTVSHKRIDSNHFEAIIYLNGQRASQCKIWRANGSAAFGSSICYSSSLGGNDNSLNDSLSVQSDGYTLTLKAFGLRAMFHGGKQIDQFSMEGASEYYWDQLVRQLQ